METKESFKFPSNVKQIGSIDDEFKVYIEDFAYTYICQYAKTELGKDKVGVLVGDYIETDDKKVILISGMIQGKYSDNSEGDGNFTEETWEYIKAKRERYFSKYKILGWIHTKYGTGITLSDEDIEFHKDYFFEPYQVLLILDIAERIDTFFCWDDEGKDLRELDGYFIYYEKNDDMQEYMLSNKIAKSKIYISEEEDQLAEKEDVIVNYRKHDRIKREELHQKKILNMLVGTSGVVVVLCFLMGLLLVQNSERMNKLEKELVKINNAYEDLNLAEMNKTSNGTATVFASQDEAINQNKVEPVSEKESQVIDEIKESEESSTKPAETETQKPSETETSPKEDNKTETEKAKPASESTAPSQPETKAANNIPETHTVKEGENLSWISRHYYGTNKMVNKIMEYNNIDNPDKIVVGTVLKLPKE